MRDAGVRGSATTKGTRRVRSTKRRSDVPDLPRVRSTGATVGRVYHDTRTGKAFRPSLFLTVTLPSYGHVLPDGTPVQPATYDYARAARDALHFGKLLDRLGQNLRRVAGYDVQYFATIEPQKRGAPHAHLAIRGTLRRALVKQVVAATYASVWWPSTDTVRFDGYDVGSLPTWEPDPDAPEDKRNACGTFVDPATGTPLPTWREALDAMDDAHDQAEERGEPVEPVEPFHVVRFGDQVDVKGVLAGSSEAERAIGYLVKYLVKDLGDDLAAVDPRDDDLDENGERPELVDADDVTRARARRDDARAKAARVRRADHVDALVEALRYEPCSPRCANWLRYGIQPQGARNGMRPGACKAKAHRPTHLGYGGRRVLVSRKWTGKDLTDHRHDRKAHVLAILGRTPDGQPVNGASGSGGDSSATATPTGTTTPGRFIWQLAQPGDPDVDPPSMRLLRRIGEHSARQREYRNARDGTPAGTLGPFRPTTPDTDTNPAADPAA